MTIYVLTFLIGVLAGLRAFTPIAAVSWAAVLGWLPLQGTWLAFLGATVTPYVLSALAIFELISDKLPKTPSRKVPMQFGARLATGALSGAALGAAAQALFTGLALGVIGAVVGTLVASEARHSLAQAIGGKDRPIALLEDAVAIGSALCIVTRFA